MVVDAVLAIKGSMRGLRDLIMLRLQEPQQPGVGSNDDGGRARLEG